MPQANPKLFEILKKKPQQHHRADEFWPLPDTFMGIEIEIEGIDDRRIADRNVDSRWTIVQDHSLRNGEEWVLAAPLLGVSLREAIHWFFTNVSGYRISTRTSTHLHINMMDENTDGNTLRNMLGLYIAAEDYFFRVAGEDRKWSGYCAPLSEAPVDLLAAMISVPLNFDGLYRALKVKRGNADRYYALNLLSLERHGTFEFRHFPCTTKEEDVIKWTRMVMSLKLGAMNMATDGVDAFTALGRAENVPVVLNKYVPSMAHSIMEACDIYHIASKINAVYTYSTNNVSGVRYDASKPGLLKSWFEKHNKKIVDLSDEDVLLEDAQTKKKEWAYRVGLNLEFTERMKSILDHIEYNKRQRQQGNVNGCVFIDRYIRLFHGTDMLPADERRRMMEQYPDREREFRAKYPLIKPKLPEVVLDETLPAPGVHLELDAAGRTVWRLTAATPAVADAPVEPAPVPAEPRRANPIEAMVWETLATKPLGRPQIEERETEAQRNLQAIYNEHVKQMLVKKKVIR